jgi:flagellar hook-associated protein 2
MTSVSGTSTTSSTTSSVTTNPANVNWTSLIDQMVAARTALADTVQTELTDNQTKITTYQQMQSLLSSLESASEALGDPSNPTASSGNIFLARSATLTASGSVAASSLVGVTLSNGAATGSHTLTVTQLAEAEKLGSTVAASETTALGYGGVFSLGVTGGSAVDITIDSSMTLADVASAINGATGTSGVQASIVQVSGSQYELVVTTASTGQTVTASAVSGTDVLSSLGVTDSSGNFADVLQTAQSALFSLDGIQITRSSNEISDVLGGVTLDLYSTTPSGSTVTMSVGMDTAQVGSAVSSLVTAYNSYRDFVIQQDATDSTTGTAASTAILFGDSTLRGITSQLEDALNTKVGGLSLSSVGLSFNSANELVLDSSTLDNILSSNLTEAEQLLGFTAATSSSDLGVVTHGNSAPSSFTLAVSVDSSGKLTSASVGGDNSLFTVSGSTIVGNSGTAYAGFTFDYSGSSSKSIDVSLSYGVASLLNITAASAADGTTGTVQTIISGLETEDTTLQSRIDDIDSAAATYRTQLTTQYAKYEAEISTAESTLSYLTVMLSSSTG